MPNNVNVAGSGTAALPPDNWAAGTLLLKGMPNESVDAATPSSIGDGIVCCDAPAKRLSAGFAVIAVREFPEESEAAMVTVAGFPFTPPMTKASWMM